MVRRVLVVTIALFGSAWGCGEASYELYQAEDVEVVLPEGTGGDPGETTSESSTGGEMSAPISDAACEAERDASLPLIRLVTADDGKCVTQGEPITLVDDPAFSVDLGECVGDPTQFWTLVGLSDGTWEFRNESAGMNLDVRFASGEDGSPLVLFDHHQLYNQRFFFLPGPGSSFRLSPRHADDKCIEARSSGLEIWPCDESMEAQYFEQLPCDVLP